MSWMNALSLGRQHAQEDRAIADQQRLGKLSAAALTASPEGRNKVLGQVAALDPNAAFGMRETFQREDANAEEAARGRLVNMAKMLAAAPEPMRGGLYSQMLPGLRQMGLQAPDVWQPELMGVVQSLAGADQNAPRVQSTQVLENGEIAMFMSDGTVKRSGTTAQSPFTVKEFRNPDGTTSYERIPTRSYGEGGTYGAGPQQSAPPTSFEMSPPTGMPAPAPGPRQVTFDPTGLTPEKIAEARTRMEQELGAPIPDAEWRQALQRGSVSRFAGAPAPSSPSVDAAANRTLDAQTYGTQAPRGQGFGQTDAQRAAAEAAAAGAKARAEALAKAEVAPTVAAAESEAKAVMEAPKVVETGERLLKSINDLLVDPGLPIVTGSSGIYDPRASSWLERSSGVADTRARIKQIQGEAFLQAFNSLKGGGAITEIESAKAEQAIARLNEAQSDEGFVQALNDFKAAIEPAIQRARARMGQGGQPVPEGLPPGARQAPDGNFYVQQGGRWFRVEQ